MWCLSASSNAVLRRRFQLLKQLLQLLLEQLQLVLEFVFTTMHSKQQQNSAARLYYDGVTTTTATTTIPICCPCNKWLYTKNTHFMAQTFFDRRYLQSVAAVADYDISGLRQR